MSSNNDVERVNYLKETNVHHLFELLASRVLSQRPKDVYQFLRDQLTDIERSDKASKKKNDPTELSSRASAAAGASAAATTFVVGESDAAAAAKPSKPKEQDEDGHLQKLTLAVFGLDNAGKTALISAIGGNPTANTRPTVGFNPTFFETDTSKVCVFDLGGASSFRSIWKHYYHDLHGVIFVVDGSDEKRFAEAAAALKECVEHPYMQDKPLVLFVNKRDHPGFLGVDEVLRRLGADTIAAARTSRPFKVLPICAINEDLDAETNIEAGLEWLLETVKQYFQSLSKLVEAHSAEVKDAKKKALEEQARRVAAAREADGKKN